MRPLISLVLCLSLLLSTPAYTCSTFALERGDRVLFGRNMDSAVPVAGLVLVNQRNVPKRLLPWGTFAPRRIAGPAAGWISKYGSVTITAMGRDFPDGGMNEAGLVVEEMTLSETVFPTSPAAISQSQWIQYQLDNFASVDEVLANLDALPMAGWGWHFLVADASGKCAAVEFLQGKAVVGRDARIAGCVLTNDSLARSMEHLSRFDGFGGLEPMPQSRDSLSRFVRAVAQVSGAPRTASTNDAEFAFEVLASIDQGSATQRSIVHDITARKIHFRTAAHPQIKSIDLNRLDFSNRRPPLMLDVETALAGDVTDSLVRYDEAANRRVIESFLQVIHATEEVAKSFRLELRQADLNEAQFIELLTDRPESGRDR